MQNVVTSMDYERLLSSTGPFGGEALRISDHTHPKNIAWIQCVGSRRVTEGDNSYCSGVCCTYTQKQVILTKEHDSEARCTIFHNDIRSFGKDFERYFQRAENLDGVKFIRSYAAISGEKKDTKNVLVRYATNDEGVKEEEFDMVVLSVGLNRQRLTRKLRKSLESSSMRMVSIGTMDSNPILTSRPGIFVSGAFQGPTDIPESVFTASGAGSQIGEMLDYRATSSPVSGFTRKKEMSQTKSRESVCLSATAEPTSPVSSMFPPRLSMR